MHSGPNSRRLVLGGFLLCLSLLLCPATSLPQASAVTSSWSVNEKVNDDAGTFLQDRPDIAIDSAGNPYALWRDLRNGTHDGHWDLDIYFSCRRPEGGWSVNQRVNDDVGTEVQDWPALVVDGAGNAHAVWKDYRNGDPDVYYSYRPTGGNWSANQRVDDGGTTDVDHPDVAIDSAGNLYALWQDWRSDDPDVYFSYRPAHGSWGPGERVSDAVTGTLQYPAAIAVDGAGNAYAVWTDKRNGDAHIYFSHRPAGGSWSANERVDGGPGNTEQWSPAIAVDEDGNAYAVWQDNRNGDDDVYSGFRPAGDSWGPDVRVNDDTGSAGQSGVAIAVQGDAVAAVWQDERNAESEIYYSYRLPPGTWSANERVSDDPGVSGRCFPAIALGAPGSAYVVWSDERSGNPDIYFSHRSGWFAIRLPIVLVGP